VNRPLLVHVSITILAGLAVVIWNFQQLLATQPGPETWLGYAIWLAILLGLGSFHVVSSEGTTTSTLNSALNYCLILVFGAPFAGPAVAINSFRYNTLQRKTVWYRSLFNVSQTVLAVNAANLVYHALGGKSGQLPDLSHPAVLLMLSLPFVAFTLVNLGLVTLAIRLQTGMGFRSQFSKGHYFELWGNLILFYLGALLAYLYLKFGWMGFLLSAIPLGWVYSYLRRLAEVQVANEQLARQQNELEKGNQELARLNDELRENEDSLKAKSLEIAQVNQSLKDLNEELLRTRKSLVQSEKMKAMGQLASGVAHDFNNVLGSIVARAELMQLEELTPDVRSGLELIHRSALDGAAVVRRIQDFSRVTQETNFSPLNARELMSEVVEMMRPIWKDRANRLGITYRVSLEGSEDVWVRGNASELLEVFHNLFQNALDAMQTGGSLRLACITEGERAVLEVQDSGHGMTPEVLERLFDPFFTTKGKRGNGLGLSMAQGIIQRHQGELLATSELGAGSTFRITLPLDLPPAETSSEKRAPRKEALRGLRSRRILVVDDEPDVRNVLCDILKMMGHEVSSAAEALEALEICQREGQDLIFTDLGMPGMNGWEFADRLRKSESERGLPPAHIVMVSGWGAQIRQEDLSEHKVDRALAKPFKLDRLKALLQELEDTAA
jgi:signal transduction histidine kinase/ActR/RegA family two-component response regulator